MLLKNGGTPTLVFLMVDSTDGETAETGLSPSVTISKNGGSFAATTNSAAEIGSGWYKVALTATETNTDGSLIVIATATGAKDWHDVHEVYTSISTDTEHNYIADHVLKRSLASAEASAAGDGGTSPAIRSLLGVVAKQTGRTKNNSGSLEIYESDDTTLWSTQALTTGSGDPITEVGGAT